MSERGLTWYFWWGIFTSIPNWTYSQNSPAAAEALSLKISSHGTSQMIKKTVPISRRIVISYAMKPGILLWIWWKVRGNETIWSEFPNGGKAIVEQELASKEINKSKRAELWKSVWNYNRVITEFKVSKDKQISIWIDRKNLIHVRWNRIKNHA